MYSPFVDVFPVSFPLLQKLYAYTELFTAVYYLTCSCAFSPTNKCRLVIKKIVERIFYYAKLEAARTLSVCFLKNAEQFNVSFNPQKR